MQDIPIGNSGNDINNSHIITASNWVGHGGQHFHTSPPHNLVSGSPRCLTILIFVWLIMSESKIIPQCPMVKELLPRKSSYISFWMSKEKLV